MPPSINSVFEAFGRLPAQRRILLIGVVVGSLIALLAVARWATTPDYSLLFGNLAASDAGKIVEQIESQGVAYELRDGGTSIYVPRSEVYGLRLGLASSGVVPDGPAGYELFDTGTLGMTDFMQRLNVKRALEGELARTVGALRQVNTARVHLVLPERSPFRDQQVSPSASVVLGLGSPLAPDQVAGVAALVAGAVEGMAPADVTVLDEGGRMLTGPEGMGVDAGLTSAQLRMRQEVEAHVAQSGQSMLDQMLGPGRAVVRVSAEVDLATTQSETLAVDPETQTLVSEENQEEVVQGGGGASSTVRNYDFTRKTTRADQEAGAIQRLSVSVLLDEAAPPADAAAAPEADAHTPFTEAQLRQIESLVKTAVGFDEERGDRFAVQQIRFSADAAGALSADAAAQRRSELIALAIRYGVILLALFLAYRLLRSLAQRLSEPLPMREPDGPLAMGAALPALTADDLPEGVVLPPMDDEPTTVIEAVEGDIYVEKLSDDARQHLADSVDALIEVSGMVKKRPEEAARVVREWLHEDTVRGAETLEEPALQ